MKGKGLKVTLSMFVQTVSTHQRGLIMKLQLDKPMKKLLFSCHLLSD